MATAPSRSATRYFSLAETIEVFGDCDDRFFGLQAILAERSVLGREVGSAVSVMVDGRPAVDPRASALFDAVYAAL